MKKTTFFTTSIFLFASVTLGSAVFAVDYPSNTQITFEENTGITPPVDPTNPDPNNPVTPIDPTRPGGTPVPGTPGPLSIDFASSFDFGTQTISTANQTYYAALQTFNGTPAGPNYVQVTDTRGSLVGWSLSVKQNGQLETSDSEVLTGAAITLNNASVASNLTATAPELTPETVLTTLTLDPAGAETPVVVADEDQGAGTWVYRFGNDATSGATAVALMVPGTTLQLAEAYSTTITWTLADTP